MDTMRLLLALETINRQYPEEDWLYVYTDGSRIDGHVNVGAGIYSKLFSMYMTVGKYKTAYGGEIEAIRVALCQLTCHQDKFNKAVILSDSKAAIQAIVGLEQHP